MGPEKMMVSGFWIIPAAMCTLFMIVMFVSRMHGRIGHGMFMNHQNQPGRAEGTNSPIDILNNRYAKGEIDTEEYETIKRNIQNKQ